MQMRRQLSFGAYVTADLYIPVPKAAGRPNAQAAMSAQEHQAVDGASALPVVIFLPGHSYHTGFPGAYGHLTSSSQGGLLKAIVARGVEDTSRGQGYHFLVDFVVPSLKPHHPARSIILQETQHPGHPDGCASRQIWVHNEAR